MDIFRLARAHVVREELGDAQEVRFVFWSFVPAIHDGLVGVKGHFMASVAALKQVRKLGVTTIGEIPLCKSNVGTLEKLVRLLISLGVTQVECTLPEQANVSLLPRMELLLGYLACLPEELLLRCRFVRIPLCVLPVGSSSEVQDYDGVYVSGCQQCLLRDVCRGVPISYLRAYGQVAVSARTGEEHNL